MRPAYPFALVLVLASLLAPACATKPPSSPESPGLPAPPAVQCGPKQITASGKCFDSADAACAALGCPRADCVMLETAPAQATCKH